MKYQLFYSSFAFEDIKKLDSVAKKRVKKKIELFAINPLFYAKRLINSSIGSFRWRIGNYRIVFDLEKDKIIILRIGHRREIYK